MATKIHHVPLSELPADVRVPDDLRELFWFDAERKRLCFDGFMSKDTFDRLVFLSGDRKYQTALEELFRISVPDDVPDGASQLVVKAVAITILSLVVLSGVVAWLLMAK